MTTIELTYASCSLEIVKNENGRITTKTIKPMTCSYDTNYPDLVNIMDSNGHWHTIDHKFVDVGTYATPQALFDSINTDVKDCLAL